MKVNFSLSILAERLTSSRTEQRGKYSPSCSIQNHPLNANCNLKTRESFENATSCCYCDVRRHYQSGVSISLLSSVVMTEFGPLLCEVVLLLLPFPPPGSLPS